MYGDGIGDTAFYNPLKNAIIHFKRSTYFLVGICSAQNIPILSDFNIGEKVSPGWTLPRNPIAQGHADSIMCLDLDLTPNGKEVFCYYMIAGTNLKEIYELNEKFIDEGFEFHLQNIQKCHKKWLSQLTVDLSTLPPRLQQLYLHSLLIIKTQINANGAILAANDSDNMQFNKDTYSYMWPRDAALVAVTLIKTGFAEMTKPFFEFCRDVLYEDGCLLHKYNPDKTLGSSWHPWIVDGKFSLPIQEDETALVLYALWKYYEQINDKKFIETLYPTLIKPMGDFLIKYRYENGLPIESYGLWEERRGIFTFTTAAVLAGLIAAEKLGHIVMDTEFCERCTTGFDVIKKAMLQYLLNQDKGYFRRSVTFEKGVITYDETMDSSVYGLFEFGVFNEQDEHVIQTMKLMREWLWVKTKIGGIARYYNDHYHQISSDLDTVPGNPWFICTLWYAKWVIKKAKQKKDLKEALEILNWVADHALSTGVIAEQLHPFTGEPLSVSPLTWSHAEFVDTTTNYLNKMRELK
jgi:GH15 family glucan-1,4-alpha-glucosidase